MRWTNAWKDRKCLMLMTSLHHHHPLHNNHGHGHQPIGCMAFLRYNQDRDDFEVGKTSKIKIVVNKSR
jgi:hypothetical protein